MNYDFQCERRLAKLNPEYSQLVKNTAFVMTNALDRYSLVFPTYTDHSVLHALQVINFCNQLIADQAEMLNEDELFVLLMSCYMHDTGMGITEKDYQQLYDAVVSKEFISEHPDADIKEIIRNFHHEFSGKFIRKYRMLFEIPTEEHVEAIVQVSRGHRKTDLFDEKEYPVDYMVPSGNTVCLPYLASLIRLADELDIASDRNVLLEDDHPDNFDWQKHEAIKRMEMTDDEFILYIYTDDPELRKFIEHETGKLQNVLDVCRNATNTRTKFRITQKKVNIIYN